MKKNNRNGKKLVVFLLALTLLLGCAIGGTIAYLTAVTPKVSNTFTTSDINITLTESEGLNLKMVPGKSITKDPVITVTKGSEACYLFVKVEAANGVALAGQSTEADYITYSMADGWIPLTGTPGVYYREVDALEAANDLPFHVLADDKVTVLTTVTEAMMTAAKTNAPELTFTAYAVQFESVADVAAAWDLAKGLQASNP